MKASNAVLQAAVAAGQLDEYMTRNIILRSKRGLPLIATNTFPEGGAPTVTVEAYVKWYSLYLIRRAADEFLIEEVSFSAFEPYCLPTESAYVDHVPNPVVVARWAAKNDYTIDTVALETIIGRWEVESRNNYQNLGD